MKDSFSDSDWDDSDENGDSLGSHHRVPKACPRERTAAATLRRRENFPYASSPATPGTRKTCRTDRGHRPACWTLLQRTRMAEVEKEEEGVDDYCRDGDSLKPGRGRPPVCLKKFLSRLRDLSGGSLIVEPPKRGRPCCGDPSSSSSSTSSTTFLPRTTEFQRSARVSTTTSTSTTAPDAAAAAGRRQTAGSPRSYEDCVGGSTSSSPLEMLTVYSPVTPDGPPAPASVVKEEPADEVEVIEVLQQQELIPIMSPFSFSAVSPMFSPRTPAYHLRDEIEGVLQFLENDVTEAKEEYILSPTFELPPTPSFKDIYSV